MQPATNPHTYLLQFDGASRGNGTRRALAGAGAVIYQIDAASGARKEIWADAKFLGNRTNNEAEYLGLLLGLCQIRALCLDNGAPAPTPSTNIHVEGDSNLVIQQVTGRFKVNATNLAPLRQRVVDKVAEIVAAGGVVTFAHVYRDKNVRADELSNVGVDTASRRDVFV